MSDDSEKEPIIDSLKWWEQPVPPLIQRTTQQCPDAWSQYNLPDDLPAQPPEKVIRLVLR